MQHAYHGINKSRLSFVSKNTFRFFLRFLFQETREFEVLQKKCLLCVLHNFIAADRAWHTNQSYIFPVFQRFNRAISGNLFYEKSYRKYTCQRIRRVIHSKKLDKDWVSCIWTNRKSASEKQKQIRLQGLFKRDNFKKSFSFLAYMRAHCEDFCTSIHFLKLFKQVIS